MTSGDMALGRKTAAIVVALVGLRLICATFTPLAFDEAYYWTWSKHLAGGYYDHPPMVAYVIRLGTMIAGDTELGVRLVSVLLALPMSFAVYRAAAILFPGRRIAADAAILLNATLLVAVGTVIVTPDSPLMGASALVLLSLAKVIETGRGVWWLAVGASVGMALLSKYTALFFGPIILIWLLAVPGQRRWLVSPWPYLGAVVALVVFVPVIQWNAAHDWVSFIKQLGRARADGFSPKSAIELIPVQFAFATPLVFALGAMGLYRLGFRRAGAVASRVLIGSTVGVIATYFVWHALHSRVEANWFAPIYPAAAVAAAVAAHDGSWHARTATFVAFCRRWALPSGVVLFVLLVVQANTGWLLGSFRDGTARTIGVGWPQLAREVDAARRRADASCILGSDYATTSWLMFYLPKDTCIVSRVDRIRWDADEEPKPAKLAGKVLFFDRVQANGRSIFDGLPPFVRPVDLLTRQRGGLIIDTFQLDLLDGSKGDLLDRSAPAELQRYRGNG